MACSNCGRGKVLGPAKSNGGLYIMDYIGDVPQTTEIGEVTGTVYSFGTSKKQFWADFRDIPGLFRSDSGDDLRSKKQ